MHTRQDLTPAHFRIEIGGRPARIHDVLPGLALDSRVAIVTRSSAGVFGVATLVLALVTDWYESLARRTPDFFEYPDMFHLHAGDGPRPNVGPLEIWPPHKQASVSGTTQALLEALVDRSIDHLLVEDGDTAGAQVLRETRNGVSRRLRGAVAFAATGRPCGADVTIRASAASERHVARAIEASTSLDAEARAMAQRTRSSLAGVEHVRRIRLPEAMSLLSGASTAATDAPWGLAGIPRDDLEKRVVSLGAAPARVR